MELRHIRYFVKAAELLHFTRAADALHVSQPTLSVQIHELEQELRTPLFERVGRTVRLTDAGKLFLGYAQQALSQIEVGQQCLYDLQGLLRGTLRIGATAPFGAELLPEVVAEFLRLHPGTQIVLTKAPTHIIEEGLNSGTFDLGLVYQSASAPQDFDSRELFKVEVVVVVAHGHILSKRRSLRLHDLSEVPLALPSAAFATRQAVNAAFTRAKISPRVILETNDVEALFEVVRRGIAATLLPRQVAANVADLSKIRLAEEGLLQTAAFVWPRGGRLTPAAKRFLELASGIPKRRRVIQ